VKTAAINNEERCVSEMYQEGIRYFMGEGRLNSTLKQLAADLEVHSIDYVVIGGMALFAHKYPRFTQDIDVVVSPEGLGKFQRKLLGIGGWGMSGYLRKTPASDRNFRSVPLGVGIKVTLTGEYPGDGKPKPVSMPNPQTEFVEIDGVHFVSLEKLIELKLASGMTAGDRLKDLADVQELIKTRRLPSEFVSLLDPYVRAKFLELYQAVEQARETEEQ
jgi:hypothetical protein